MKQILLTQSKVAFVDDEDYPQLSRFNWCAEKQKQGHKVFFYAKRVDPATQDTILMHRQILSAPKDRIVDHKDSDGLNNRRSNLRLCGHTENHMNGFEIKPNKTSRFKGVNWDKGRSKWLARTKGIFIGRFDEETVAALAYDRVVKEKYGEFAYLNFPKEDAHDQLSGQS